MLLLLSCASLLIARCAAQKFEGEVCEASPGVFGQCSRVESCSSALEDIRNQRKPTVCSYRKDRPIVCCVNPNIVALPAETSHVWPSMEEGEGEGAEGRPPQGSNQRPLNGQRPFGSPGQAQQPFPSQRPPFGGQRPPGQNQPFGGQQPSATGQRPPGGQGPNQPPFGGRPPQPPFGGQGPNQQPSVTGQRPPGGPGPNQPPFGGRPPQPPFGGQGPNQQPSVTGQRPPGGQGPNQPPFGGRPPQPPFGGQGPNQQLPPGGQSPTQPSPAGGQQEANLKPTRRPWWMIPNRKTTESPSVIDNPATLPMNLRRRRRS